MEGKELETNKLLWIPEFVDWRKFNCNQIIFSICFKNRTGNFLQVKGYGKLGKRLIKVDKVTEKLELWQLHSIKFKKISK